VAEGVAESVGDDDERGKPVRPCEYEPFCLCCLSKPTRFVGGGLPAAGHLATAYREGWASRNESLHSPGFSDDPARGACRRVSGTGRGSGVSSQMMRPRTVLAVFWGPAVANAVTNAALDEILRSRTDLAIDYYSEYLESDRLPHSASDALCEYIVQKYRDRHVDLVIASADPALHFVLQHRDRLFPNAPIVFAGVNPPDAAVRNAGPGITGVVNDPALRDTLELALKLHPSTERIFVVETAGGTSSIGDQLASVGRWIQVQYINEPSVVRLLDQVRAIPARSVVLLVPNPQFANNPMRPAQITRMVAEAATVPVYGVSETYVGLGMVGTAGTSRQSVGTRVGTIALQVLDGVRPQDIPLLDSPRQAVFDWRQLRRWNIAPSSLPAGADIRFRLPRAWELYHWYFLGAAVLVGLQSVLIALLVIHRSRRRETEARNVAILQAVPDLMFLLTTDGVYVDYHVPDPSLLLVRPDEFLGKGMRDVLPLDLAKRFEELFARQTPGQKPQVIEYSLPMPDGDRHYEARVVPVQDNHVLAVVRDITERRRAEDALHGAQAELRRASRLSSLGEFAATIAHELRQPLTAIIMSARSCLRGIGRENPDVEDIRAGLLDVVEASLRADEVIRRNRRLFRDRAVETVPLDINGVIREAIVLAAPRLTESDVGLATTLADDLPTVAGDRIELQQVLLNLIANAIEAMDAIDAPSRRIQVFSSRDDDGSVRVAVTDNGRGLGDVNVQQMFTLSYTTKATGTGVGLSISRSIIEAHGGRLWAEENTSVGTTFSFTVPIPTTVPSAVSRDSDSEVT
jgi:PAS domain S-box-containing protein